VGPVRLRTWHTLNVDCPLKTALDNCFDLSMTNLDTGDKDGISYQSCSDLGITYTLTDGEYYNFGCDGYVIDLFPNQTSPADF